MKKRLGGSLEWFQYWDPIKKQWEYTGTGIRVKPGDQLYLASEQIIFESDFSPIATSPQKRPRSHSLDTAASASPTKLSKTALNLPPFVLIHYLSSTITFITFLAVST